MTQDPQDAPDPSGPCGGANGRMAVPGPARPDAGGRCLDRIRALNDAFRAPGLSLRDWFFTAGVEARGPEFMDATVAAVAAYASFDEGDDPYGEHDFGSFELDGERLFWKIDYQDLDLRHHSSDPGDVKVTRRVLTIMLASDY